MEKRVDERIKSIKVYVGGKGSEVLEKLIGDVIFFGTLW